MELPKPGPPLPAMWAWAKSCTSACLHFLFYTTVKNKNPSYARASLWGLICVSLKVEDREKTVSSASGFGKAGQPHVNQWNQKISSTRTEISSKWLEDLNIRQDATKLLEENRSKTFSEISSTNVFLGQSPKATEIEAKIKWRRTRVSWWRWKKRVKRLA